MKERIEPSGLASADEYSALDEAIGLGSLLREGDALRSIPSDRASAFADAARGDIIGALAASYFRALENPRDQPPDNWDQSHIQLDQPAAEPETQASEQSATTAGSISDLLGEAGSLEEAFGSLDEFKDVIAAPAEVPEILAVFAPADYHARVAKRAGQTAPELARREHHTLAIDSPMQHTIGVAVPLDQCVSEAEE